MKRISKLKLNAIAESRLAKKEMNALQGGVSCGCACLYEDEPGGSSTDDNDAANKKYGYHSPGMIQIAGWYQEDGSWLYYPIGEGPWIPG